MSAHAAQKGSLQVAHDISRLEVIRRFYPF